MRKTHKRPPDARLAQAPPDGLSSSPTESSQVRTEAATFTEAVTCAEASALAEAATLGYVEGATLGSLPVGARLVLRCRADWRTATVAAFDAERGRVVLNVASPSGHTYRVRRPQDSPLAHEGHVPLLGEGCWRAGLARYDVRW
ncbi:MAG: hypothetical protein QOJ76_2010 [Acidobacteriota bacterium]|nr:hypothetical protein [Acidobacteriota bacterium]